MQLLFPPPPPPLQLFLSVWTVSHLLHGFKRGQMTGANACGNVGNVLSKQNNHLQQSTAESLHLAPALFTHSSPKKLTKSSKKGRIASSRALILYPRG